MDGSVLVPRNLPPILFVSRIFYDETGRVLYENVPFHPEMTNGDAMLWRIGLEQVPHVFLSFSIGTSDATAFRDLKFNRVFAQCPMLSHSRVELCLAIGNFQRSKAVTPCQ